jgi:hypothetical protein
MLINDELILGAMVFGLIKLVGYYYVAAWAGRQYRLRQVAAPLIVALARIALGAIFAWLITSAVDVEKSWPWYLVLVLLRTVEWGLVFWRFYERPAGRLDWNRLVTLSCFSTLASCVLDLPAAFGAFVIPAMAYGIC